MLKKKREVFALNAGKVHIGPMTKEPKAFQIWRIIPPKSRFYYSRDDIPKSSLLVLILGFPRNFTTLSCSRVLAGEPIKPSDFRLKDGRLKSLVGDMRICLGKTESFPASSFQEFLGELNYEEIQQVHDLLVQSAR